MKFATVNIERSKHLSRVENFLKTQAPDVVCLQEVPEHELTYFQNFFGGPANITWVPMTTGFWSESPAPQVMGIAIASVYGLHNIGHTYYHGQGRPNLPNYEHNADGVVHDTISHALLTASVTVKGVSYRIGCVHHTWTKDGLSTDFQMVDTANLIAAAQAEGELVMAGDFNAPRGRAAFALLAENFKDNIPPELTTSIDGTLHRAGQLNLMVDGIFTTPAYAATNVTMHTGVSDHCAFTADITKLIAEEAPQTFTPDPDDMRFL